MHYSIWEFFSFSSKNILLFFCLRRTLNLRETSDVSLKWAALRVKVWGFAAFRPSKGSNRCSGSFPQCTLLLSPLSSTQPSLLYTCKAPQEGGWCGAFAAHNWTACVYTLPRTISGLAVGLCRAFACGDSQNGACCHVITHGVFTSLHMDGWIDGWMTSRVAVQNNSKGSSMCHGGVLIDHLIDRTQQSAFIYPTLGKLSLQQHVGQWRRKKTYELKMNEINCF